LAPSGLLVNSKVLSIYSGIDMLQLALIGSIASVEPGYGRCSAAIAVALALGAMNVI